MPGVRIAIVTGSTRPGRNNAAVARWVLELAARRRDADFELVDIAENVSVFRPDPRHEAELNAMLDLVIAWARALKSLRSKARAEAT